MIIKKKIMHGFNKLQLIFFPDSFIYIKAANALRDFFDLMKSNDFSEKFCFYNYFINETNYT